MRGEDIQWAAAAAMSKNSWTSSQARSKGQARCEPELSPGDGNIQILSYDFLQVNIQIESYDKDEITNTDEMQPQTMIPKIDDCTNEVERQQVLSCGQLSGHRKLQKYSHFDKSVAKSARDIGRRKQQHNVLASRWTFPQVVTPHTVTPGSHTVAPRSLEVTHTVAPRIGPSPDC